MEFLRVEEVGERVDSGATEPYFCRLSDDGLYVAKGRSALSRGLVAEVVCGGLGRALGLPIPEVAIATINTKLLAMNHGAKASLGDGPLFASKYRNNLDQVTRESLSGFDEDVLRKLFAFDYWIMNGDRTGTVYGGNSNLFVDVTTGDLVVLDHNLAFDNSFDVNSHLKYHICRDAWFGNPLREAIKGPIIDAMGACLAEIQSFEDDIPEEWLVDDPHIVTNMKKTLTRINDADFWGPL